MTKPTLWLAGFMTAGLIVLAPAGASAQRQPNGAGPRAHPAPHAAPAVHAAPRAMPQMHAAPRAMPQIHAGPRASFHPQPQIRSVPHNFARQHMQPRIQRHIAAPQINRRHNAIGSVAPHNATRVNRAAERRLHRQQLRQQALPNSNRLNRAAERRLQRQQLRQQAMHPNAAGRRNAVTTGSASPSAAGINRTHRIDPNVARQGRFSAAFAKAQASNGRHDHWRNNWWAARRAWHHHRRARFVAWVGPVFWPYAYSDIFDYTFWPEGYDDGYWAYAYDDFFDSVFWGAYGPPEVYAYAPSSRSAPPRARQAAVEQLCRDPGSGITAWPFAQIERIGLNADQKKLLDDLRNAGREATDAFKSSCPSADNFAVTPPGRLAAMTARLEATLKAVEIVKPPLEAFYNSLSDEQKERFNEIGPGLKVNAEARAALPDQAKACGEAKPGLTNLPIEQIQDALKPSDQQADKLDRLGEATVKAVSMLQKACPDEVPITPTGRLQAMDTRLKAMIDAAGTVKAPLETFYSSLSNEQKARFNQLGRELASND